MAKKSRVDWAGDAGFEFVDMKKQGKSYREIINFLYAKYGVAYTQARMSQIAKRFREQGLLQVEEFEADVVNTPIGTNFNV